MAKLSHYLPESKMTRKLIFAALLLLPLLGVNAAQSERSITKNLSGVDSALTVSSLGFGTIAFQATGTWSATVKFEGTVTGSDWATIRGVNQRTGTADTVATANGNYLLPSAGFQYVRARVSAYTSGPAVLKAVATESPGPVSLLNGSGGGGAGDASASNQTDGSQKTQIVDGSGNVIGATSNALDVNIKSGAGSGGTAMTDDAAFTPATTSVTPIAGFADETGPDAVDEGDAGAVRMTLQRGLHVNIRNASGTELGVAAAPVRVDPTGTTTQPVSVASALPAGTNAIGKLSANSGVDIGDVDVLTLPDVALAAGTNNIGDVDVLTEIGTSATGSAVPASAKYMGAVTAGNLVGVIQAGASAKIDVSTATTTEIVALSGSTKIYVTSWDVIAAGTGTFKWVYGTGTACGTGTTDLTGAYSLVAQSGISKGGGLGPVLVAPAGNALCVTTDAAVGMQGSVAYTQF